MGIPITALTKLGTEKGTYSPQLHIANENGACSARSWTWWNERYLGICVEVKDDVVVFGSKGIEQNTIRNQDSIWMVFVNYETGKEKILYILPYAAEGKIYVNMGTEGIMREMVQIHEEDYNCSIKLRESGYEITLNIPWRLIDIEPREKRRIGFSVAINDVHDPLARKHRTLIIWEGRTVGGPVRCGKLILNSSR